jgi:hypothetical protein
LICSLYEEFIFIILVIQTSLFSIFFFILFKKVQKNIRNNITSSNKVLDDKIDKLTITINNLSDVFLKKNDMYYESPSLQKTLSEIYLLLEKANSTLVKFDNDKLHTKNRSSNGNSNNDDFNSSSSLSSPSSSSHSLVSSGLTSNRLETNMEEFMALKDEIENAENDDEDKNTNEQNTHQNFENNSVNELKTLEKEILIALKRLEKTNSNFDVKKGKKEN